MIIKLRPFIKHPPPAKFLKVPIWERFIEQQDSLFAFFPMTKFYLFFKYFSEKLYGIQNLGTPYNLTSVLIMGGGEVW